MTTLKVDSNVKAKLLLDDGTEVNAERFAVYFTSSTRPGAVVEYWDADGSPVTAVVDRVVTAPEPAKVAEKAPAKPVQPVKPVSAE